MNNSWKFHQPVVIFKYFMKVYICITKWAAIPLAPCRGGWWEDREGQPEDRGWNFSKNYCAKYSGSPEVVLKYCVIGTAWPGGQIWRSVHGSNCSNILQVHLTWTLLSVRITCISSENHRVRGCFLLTTGSQWSVLRYILRGKWD